MPVSVYDNLISTVRANLLRMFRYYALRKRVLGLAEIHQCDTYVPIVPSVEKRTTFDEAIEHGAQVNAEARMTDDCKAGIAKFLQK